ncbi:IclR family transcriptional regulator C-terminal domain-containing protein [Pseudonocardia benzenivorans]
MHDQLDETASLAVLDGDEALFVARVEAARIVSAGVRVGSALPLHASATGRVLLAGMSDEELDERLRRARPQQTTPNTLLTVADIRDRVHKVRSEGVAYTDEELEYGMRTMAVPVSDATGRTQAAMAVSVFSARVSMERLQGSSSTCCAARLAGWAACCRGQFRYPDFCRLCRPIARLGRVL